MVSDPKAGAFETCLQYLQAGADIEEVLRLYPQWADELRPMLAAAQAARRLGADVHTPKAALARSRARFLAEASRRRGSRSGWFVQAPVRLAMAALVVLVVLFFLGGTSIVVSAKALPGEALYPVKLLAEQTRLLFTSDPSRRLQLEQTYDRERVREVDALINRSRRALVNFAGGLVQMQGNEWLVDNIRVIITRDTQIADEVRTGMVVTVRGELGPDGAVIALQVQHREFQITGELQEMAPERWVISGVGIRISPETVVLAPKGPAVPGSRVRVQATQMVGGELQAQVIDVLSIPAVTIAPTMRTSPVPTDTAFVPPAQRQGPTHTTRPEATKELDETSEPPESEQPSKTPKPEETEEEEVEETPKPTKTPKPSETEEPDETPEPSESVEPTRTPRPTETEEEDETPEPTRPPKPTDTPQPDPEPDPDPTEKPKPTETEETEEPPESALIPGAWESWALSTPQSITAALHGGADLGAPSRAVAGPFPVFALAPGVRWSLQRWCAVLWGVQFCGVRRPTRV